MNIAILIGLYMVLLDCIFYGFVYSKNNTFKFVLKDKEFWKTFLYMIVPVLIGSMIIKIKGVSQIYIYGTLAIVTSKQYNVNMFKSILKVILVFMSSIRSNSSILLCSTPHRHVCVQ